MAERPGGAWPRADASWLCCAMVCRLFHPHLGGVGYLAADWRGRRQHGGAWLLPQSYRAHACGICAAGASRRHCVALPGSAWRLEGGDQGDARGAHDSCRGLRSGRRCQHVPRSRGHQGQAGRERRRGAPRVVALVARRRGGDAFRQQRARGAADPRQPVRGSAVQGRFRAAAHLLRHARRRLASLCQKCKCGRLRSRSHWASVGHRCCGREARRA